MPESKETTFEVVKNTAIDVLTKRGHHAPQLIIEFEKAGKKELAIVIIPMPSGTPKEKIRQFVKSLILDEFHSKRYWMIMEAWLSVVNKGELPFIPASRNIDRKSVLVLSEFNSDLTTKSAVIPFKKEGEVITFEEELPEEKVKEMKSMWNAYVEEEGIAEGMDKEAAAMNKAFFKRVSKELAKKYFPKFNSANSDEEQDKALKEMLKEAKSRMAEVGKKVLEDVEAN